MSKPTKRPYSRVAHQAVALLGRHIQLARKEQKIAAQELAIRIGVSRGLIQRIEKGDPGCQIGAVFEAAAIVGVPLFAADSAALRAQIAAADTRLALLPKHTHRTQRTVDDNF